MSLLSNGQTFPTFNSFEQCLHQYEESTYCKYWKRDSRSIAAAKKRLKKPQHFNEEIKYAEVTYCCQQGGRYFPGRGKGERPNTSTIKQGCPSRIRAKASTDGNSLVIMDLCEEHNHEVSELLYRHIPSNRRLQGADREEAEKMLQVGANKKHP